MRALVALCAVVAPLPVAAADPEAHWGYQALTYGGLALASAAFAAERVVHNRHHLGDIIVGSLIGSVSSVAFYRYQQDRFEAVDRGGVFRAAPMLSLSGAW